MAESERNDVYHLQEFCSIGVNDASADFYTSRCGCRAIQEFRLPELRVFWHRSSVPIWDERLSDRVTYVTTHEKSLT